jgi:hypothetical protein
MKASGKDYMKNPVFEDFSWENGIAKWKNNSEEEQKTVSGKAFYQGLKSRGRAYGQSVAEQWPVAAFRLHRNTAFAE